jgi:hypothetical protein
MMTIIIHRVVLRHKTNFLKKNFETNNMPKQPDTPVVSAQPVSWHTSVPDSIPMVTATPCYQAAALPATAPQQPYCPESLLEAPPSSITPPPPQAYSDSRSNSDSSAWYIIGGSIACTATICCCLCFIVPLVIFLVIFFTTCNEAAKASSTFYNDPDFSHQWHVADDTDLFNHN